MTIMEAVESYKELRSLSKKGIQWEKDSIISSNYCKESLLREYRCTWKGRQKLKKAVFKR